MARRVIKYGEYIGFNKIYGYIYKLDGKLHSYKSGKITVIGNITA